MTIEDKYLQAFEWCFKNIKITETKKKESLIHVATKLGLDKLVEKLIRKGIDINCQDDKKTTPLHIAAHNGHIDIAKQLLENKADVDSLDEYELPPLYNAIVNNHLEIVKLFIQHGANVNLGQMSSNTNLLFHAMRKGHTEIAKLLIDNGANVNAKLRNSQGLYFTLEFPKRIRIVKRRIRIPFFQTILDIRITDIRILSTRSVLLYLVFFLFLFPETFSPPKS